MAKKTAARRKPVKMSCLIDGIVGSIDLERLDDGVDRRRSCCWTSFSVMPIMLFSGLELFESIADN